MILFTDKIFLTDEKEGFRQCRETRTTASNTMTVLLCEKGYIDVYYHSAMLRINEGEIFVRIPDFLQQLGPYIMSPDFEFKQITIEAEIYDKIMYDHIRVEPQWYAKQEYVKENPIFPLNEISKDFFRTYYHLLTLQLQDKPTPYRLQVLQYIAHGGMMEMLNYLDKLAIARGSAIDRSKTGQSDYTFKEFTRLLHLYPHEREVQWYARQLEITPKYLSEICKELSGKSASEWIAEITVAEMKHYLLNTTLPIREIAREMNFPNSSFFCQYTKKHLGETPNHIRRQKKD